jgi:beta-lactamase regulating signal transducer with metallopeptidase domain
MMWPQLQIIAQTALGRSLNSLPEGLLIALFAGMMLRILPRQNSGTRFAVWFMALLAVAGLPVAGLTLTDGAGGHSLLPVGVVRPLITLPGPWGLILFLAWMMAVFFAMLRLTTGLWHLRELRTSCVAIERADLNPAMRKAIADFSSSRSVTLATSEHVSVPAAIGFFKPLIVIPAWVLRELPPDELNIILLHEFAHLRRWDAWTNLLQKIVRAVFLFHPAVWWIDRRLSLEREMACDDQVLAETANPRGYAKCLIALLEKSVARRGFAMAHAVVHRAREASLRLAHILDVGRPDTKNVWKPALGLVGSFSLLCLMVVSRVPQFVAFARNTRAIQTDEAHSRLVSQSPIPAVAVIPAAMRTGSSSSFKKMPQQPAAHVVGHLLEHRRADPRVNVARWSGDTERNPVDTMIVGTNQSVRPASETLLIIQTMDRVGPNSWVWSVGVWRVTLVNAAQDGAEKGPVARGT